MQFKVHLFPILTNVLVSVAAVAQDPAQTPTPTPTCNPTHVEARFEPDYGPDPTYHPGDQFPLTLLPANMQDWPTTPSFFEWVSTLPGASYRTEVPDYTVVIPDPAPDTVEVYAWTRGPGISPDCIGWSTSYVWFRARRFDYIPTPTPTPSPTASPTPTRTPVDCDYYIVNPPNDAVLTTSTVVIQLRTDVSDPLLFLGLETIFGGYPHPVTQIGERSWLAENLLPNTYYVWYYQVVYGFDPEYQQPTGPICLNYFETSDFPPEPTPSPTVLPTPPPGANGWVVCGDDTITSPQPTVTTLFSPRSARKVGF